MTVRNNRIRFCQNNMLQASGATLTASGAKTGYPVANLADPYRYRLWTPPGTFVITASNQNIFFFDGSSRTVAIANATYTYLTLPAAVASAMNSVSTNWTCTYDFSGGTFKFTIARTSGTAELDTNVTTNAAWDTLGYVTGSIRSGLQTYPADQQRNHTSEFITFDLGTAKTPLLFAVIAAADTIFPISSSAVMTLKANNVNSFTSPAITRSPTSEGTGITHWLDDLSNTTYRYWQWEFQDRLNTVGPEGFSMNVAYLGDYVTPLATNVANGFTRQIVDPSIKQQSINGTSYFRKMTKRWRIDSMRIENLTQSDRLLLEAFYSQIGTTSPFFLALDPTLSISATAGEMTKYCTFDQLPVMTQVVYQLFNHVFACVEEI